MEGPSGIGKTTALLKAIEEIGVSEKVVRLSARKREDVDYIGLIPDMKDFGIVVIDDFHKLPNDVKQKIADLVKVFADDEDTRSKLIILGINEAGRSLSRICAGPGEPC